MKMKNENEMIKLAQNGDEIAKEMIINQYKPLVNHIIRKYYNNCQGDFREDLVSEGIFGILVAIDKYEEGKSSFFTFCFLQVRYYIQNYLRMPVKDSQNYGTSFDTAINNDGENTITLYDVLPDNKVNIEKDFIDRERKSQMWNLIDKYCTPNEINTLRLLATDGMTYESIAKHLDTTVSAIVRRRDRALKKIQKHL
mgnify:CR=1 FL=1